MSKSCVVYALGNNRVITNYKCNEGYIEADLDYLGGINQDFYLYNAFSEEDNSRLVLQSFIEQGFDLSLITAPTFGRLVITGENRVKVDTEFIEAIFKDDDFRAVDAQKPELDILKYIAAGFCKVYGTLPPETHSKIRQEALDEYNDIQDKLVTKYNYINGLGAIRRHLKKIQSYGELRELHTAYMATQGLVKVNFFGDSGTLMHGHTTSKIGAKYYAVLKESYTLIRLEGYGYPYTVQAGTEIDFTNIVNPWVKYRTFIEKVTTLFNEQGSDRYMTTLKRFIVGLYHKGIYVTECNPEFIALLADKSVLNPEEVVTEVKDRVGFKGVLFIK